MKAIELREKNIDDLRNLLLEQTTNQFKMRLEAGMGEVPKLGSTKSLRRQIARINTIIKEKERQA